MKEMKELIQEAHELFLEEQYEKAEKIYRELLYERMIDGPNRFLVELEYSWLLYRQKRMDEAFTILWKLKDFGDLHPRQLFDLYRLIGFIYVHRNDLLNAVQWLQKAISVDLPEGEKKLVLYELGRLYFLKGDYGEALKFLNTALRFFDPDDEYFYAIKYYLGFSYLFQENTEDAFEEFTFLVEQAPGEDKVIGGLFGIAQIFFKKQNFEGVISTCQDILSLSPDFEEKETLAYLLCRSYYELGDWENFRKFYQQLKDHYPNGQYQSIYPLFDTKLKELDGDK